MEGPSKFGPEHPKSKTDDTLVFDDKRQLKAHKSQHHPGSQ